MSKTVIIEGDENLATRDRRFVCGFCGTVFTADSENYTLATYKEQAQYGVDAFSTCPICSNEAVSPSGSEGQIPTPVALVIMSLPGKRSYRPGEKFDTTGLVVGMKLTGGIIGDVLLTDCTLSPDTSTALTVNDSKVTVTASGLSVDVPIEVRREVLPIPEIVGELVYSGKAQAPELRHFDAEKMTKGGDQSKTSAGEYALTVTPKTGYMWPGGSTSGLTFAWKIAKAVPVVTAPIPSGLTFKGFSNVLLVTGGATSGGTMQYRVGSGDWSPAAPQGHNAGVYTVAWRVVGNANYEGVDGGIVTSVIGKGTLPVTLDFDEAALVLGGSDSTSDVTTDSDGEITAVSEDPDVCSVALDYDEVTQMYTLTISPVGLGLTHVIVTAAETDNCYEASAEVTVSVDNGF